MAELIGPDSLPTLPEGVISTYRLRDPKVSEQTLRGWARRAQLRAVESAGAFHRTDELFAYREGAVLLQQHRASGAIRLIDTLRWQRDDGESSLDVSDRQAIAAAAKHVETVGLAPSDEYQVLRVSRLNVAAVDRDLLANGEAAKIEQRQIDAAVAFQRVVEGVPVDGPGGTVVVYLGTDRQVTGWERIWRDIAGRDRAVKLRQPEAVLNTLRKRWAGKQDGFIYVTDFRFGYFEQGAAARQRLLLPAYVVLLTLVSNDERIRINKVEVIPAAPGASAGLTPPRKKPLPAGGRRK